MKKNTGVLISPLDWGLGHAARCIPLIQQFIAEGQAVTVFASPGICSYLQQRFPDLSFITDKTKPVSYGFNGTGFFQIIGLIPKMIKQQKSEQNMCSALCASNEYNLIVSDNRYGFRCDNIRSVLITHQLEPIAPWWLCFGLPVLRKFIKKSLARFSEVWVPDYKNFPGLAGKLSHPKTLVSNAKYIGPLSRFDRLDDYNSTVRNDLLLVITSGPLKHRRQMAGKLSQVFAECGLSVIIAGAEINDPGENISCIMSPSDEQLAKWLSEAAVIISHAGYSTMMDLFAVGRSAIIFPTRGQTEQQYLAQLHQDFFITVANINKLHLHTAAWTSINEILKQKEIRMVHANNLKR